MVRIDYPPGRTAKSGAALRRALFRFPVLRRALAKDYAISGIFRKILSKVNPSKFVNAPLRRSLSPERRVYVIFPPDQPNLEPHWVARQADFLPCAPLWRKTTR